LSDFEKIKAVENASIYPSKEPNADPSTSAFFGDLTCLLIRFVYLDIVID
jgi:hypothetical protein